ncbi:MAG: PIN domain-containing protein [Candidatus Methanoperedens sp.]|nr:PIN domain-containing protein [Candidatus Methanoperedens sp.]
MQEDIKNNRVTLDSNVLISAVKENEKYSRDCKELLSLVGTSFLLYQPTVTIIELYNGIGRTKGEPSAKKALKDFYNMVYHLEDYGSRSQCERVAKTALKYRVYSADAIYLQTSIDFKTVIITLDKEDFIDMIKLKDAKYDIWHVSDAIKAIGFHE